MGLRMPGARGRGRRICLRTVAAATFVCVLWALGGCQRAGRRRPDVVLITLDTTRAGHLGVYGYGRPISPEIDGFAKDSVVYRRCWSTAAWTLPAHASIFTGKYPASHGAHFAAGAGEATLADGIGRGRGRYKGLFEQLKVSTLRPEEVTLAELLRAAGYETAAFVGGPWLLPVFGLLQGYSVRDAEVKGLAGRRADELTDRAVRWLLDVPANRPIHLFVNYFDPHAPYDPPPGYYEDLPAARLPLRIAADAVNRGRPLPPEQRAAYVARYDGEIRFMDHHLGRLLRALRAAGRYHGALIVVVGDHGESFGEHGLMGHARWLYEEVLRVPLIVHYPNERDAGTVVDTPVSLVDLLPLIAAATGLTLPPGVEGLPVGQRRTVFAEAYRDALAVRLYGARFDRSLVAVIQWPWKLIVPDAGEPEFYRLDRDPRELVNLRDHPAAHALRRALATVRAALRPPARPLRPRGVSPATRDQLRALGYVD